VNRGLLPGARGRPWLRDAQISTSVDLWGANAWRLVARPYEGGWRGSGW
jgi:hypothetical protein